MVMETFTGRFIVHREVARAQGLEDQAALDRAGLTGAVVGPGAIGLVTTVVLARREAESAVAAAPVVTPPLPTVPDVRRKPFAEAEQAVKAAGFTPARNDQPSGAVAQGVVFDQQPASGSAAAPGSTVQLSVSTGPRTPPPAARGSGSGSSGSGPAPSGGTNP